MKSVNKLISIILLSFLVFSSSNSNDQIAYLDLDFILKNSIIGKNTLKKINDINNENIEKLKTKEKILKDLEISISNKKNIISKEAFDKEVNKFRQKVEKFNIEQKELTKSFNDFKKKEIDNIFQLISPIINSYMERNSVQILFDAKNIFMARNDLNLTDDILKVINKEVK